MNATGNHLQATAEVDQLRLALAAAKMGTWECRLKSSGGTASARNTLASAPRSFVQAAQPPRQKSAGDFAGVEIWLSDELQEILGLSTGEFDGCLQSLLGKIWLQDRPTFLKAFTKAIWYGADLEMEIRFLRPNRPPGWLLIRGCVPTDATGQAERFVGVALEVTRAKTSELAALQAKKALEATLAARTRQLRATAQELDAICYSVSHDLRAPLRSIRGFNEVLLERYSNNLDARGQEFLRRACASSHAMEQLIEDLLKLSRIGRGELVCQSVDLSGLATGLAERLLASAPERQARFDIAPGLRARGDERLLRILLENLLGNAWKFSGKKPETRIEFGFAPAPAEAFFVRDNGAGFDPAYNGRLFGAFQRLHAESEFPGTGIGLAIVQRIINRHGGRVWADARLNAGATFYFSLPNDELT
jgi:signal transduction histidine kinase